MQLTGRLVELADVTDRQRDEMFSLLRTYYANVRRDDFEADLGEKQWVIQMVSPDGAVLGFSTQMLLECDVAGRSITALFSGDTIIRPDCWGRNPLARMGDPPKATSKLCRG